MACIDHHHALRRRHAGPRAKLCCQGAPRSAWRRAADRARSPPDLGLDGGRGLRLSDDGLDLRSRRSEGLGDSGRLPADRTPAGLTPLKQRLDEISLHAVGEARANDRHRHPPRPCAWPRLERPLRRGVCDARSLRRARILEDDTRHRPTRRTLPGDRLCGRRGCDAE